MNACAIAPAKKRILLVDDDEGILFVARLSLERVGGHEVLTASSGVQALERTAVERLDAILLDVMMPGMDGPTTFRRLQANPATRHIPVLLLTAKMHAPGRHTFAGLGVAGVLAKPFDPLQLADDVANLLGWPPAHAGSAR